MKGISQLWIISLLIVGLTTLTGCGQNDQNASTNSEKPTDDSTSNQVVNIYSARHYDNDLVIFDQFTAETGIKVNLVEGNGNGLIERIASEGANSPADLFITADAGILWRADQRNLFQPVSDRTLEEAIPSQHRHPQGHWFGLSKRGRFVIYNKEQGLPDGLTTYEDLAKPEFNDMICVRSSSNIYNQSLLASIIAHNGPEVAEEWAKGIVANFARNPQGNDTAQIEAVAAGLCRLGIVNTYYVARFIGVDDPEKAAIGDQLGVLFPNQGNSDDKASRGTHMNISGGGVLANAQNKDNAIMLMKYLTRKDIQGSFASGNNEYPIRTDVAPQGSVNNLGTFKEDNIAVTIFGQNQRQAVEIFDRAGWP